MIGSLFALLANLYRDSLMKPSLRSLLRGAFYGLLAGGLFVAGFFANMYLMPNPGSGQTRLALADPNGQLFPLLNEAKELMSANYLRTLPSATEQEYGMIRGLLSSLGDPRTFFIDPPTTASESNVFAGVYGGIGVQIRRNELGQLVLYPFRDKGAAKAGVQDGDVLLAVNGQNIDPATTNTDMADQLLRGEVKDENGVSFTVGRGSELAPFSFSVRFEVIEIPSVVWRVLAEDARIGYLQIINFTNRTPSEMVTAFTELRAANIQALVLDLRGNPGGLLIESVQVAGLFLPAEAVVLYEQQKTQEKTYKAGDIAPVTTPMTDLPMVVLINKGSASAAELVAAALHDNQRALTIGQTSFGKWSIQYIFSLSDKSSLHITTGIFYPPSRAALEGIGLKPTIEMIPDQNGRDVELGEAIRQLAAKLVG
jgi:carboxyl-terminal processing protease